MLFGLLIKTLQLPQLIDFGLTKGAFVNVRLYWEKAKNA